MNENGASYAVALAVQQLLKVLAGKGVLQPFEIHQMHESVSRELHELGARTEISPDAFAAASQTIEKIFLPMPQTPAAIEAEDLNASNDE